MLNVKTIDYAVFMAFRPIINPLEVDELTDIWERDGLQYEIVKSFWEIAPRHVWTLVHADGKNYVMSGLHHVNRFGYMITKDPSPFEHCEAEVK